MHIYDSPPITRLSATSGIKGHILSLFAGCIFALGFAPLGIWPATLISIALFITLLQGQSPGTAAFRGWLYGLGLYGVGVSWVFVSIHYHGNTPAPLAILMTFIFTGGLALLFGAQAWVYQKLGLARAGAITFASLWILFEWTKIELLSGFPWLFVGYSFIDAPLKHYAPVVGVLGISWLAVASAYFLVSAYQHRSLRVIFLAPLVIIWGGTYFIETQEWTRVSLKGPVNVSLIQGNISQEKKWDPLERDNIINTYLDLTETEWGQDIILWPEAAYPVFYNEAQEVIAKLDIQGKQHHSAIISGVPYWEEGPEKYRYYNSIFVTGAGEGMYHKQKLVPFGEFIPFEDLIRGTIPFLDLPLSSFSRGDYNQPPLIAKGSSFAPFICYEVLYPELVRRLGKDADFLLTVSNDAWFGKSWGPNQHFEMVRMRALELGKYMLRGTNTGITAIIDHKGNVISQIPQFEAGVLRGQVLKTSGHTPYSLYGYWPLLALATLIIVICSLLTIWQQKSGNNTPSND
ncbi:apolipoprotein N-acyltransferase [Gammaproteobacteria bacterium 45_16_T64]|nr:apolipoprotein N-acyltransferase [Gammaproteobacteria bacterium 45_16_T64]